MTISITIDGKKVIFELDGRLDTTTSPKLQESLTPVFDDSIDEIILDFKNLSYISSAGLRVLLMGQKLASAKQKPMSICNVSEEVMEVFEMTGFADMLTIA